MSLKIMTIRAFEPAVHEGRRPHGGAAGTDAARGSRSRSGSGDRRLAAISRTDLGASYIQLSAALHPSSRTCRPKRCSIRWRTRSTCASRSTRRGRAGSRRPLTPRGVGLSDVGYFDNLLHHDPAIRAKKHALHAARVRRRGAARRRRRLRLRRPQSAAQHGREPDGLRGAVHPAAESGKGPRADLSRRAVSDARLDDRRQLAQQHRLHARHRGSPCTASARSTASAISSGSTTTRRTPS